MCVHVCKYIFTCVVCVWVSVLCTRVCQCAFVLVSEYTGCFGQWNLRTERHHPWQWPKYWEVKGFNPPQNKKKPILVQECLKFGNKLKWVLHSSRSGKNKLLEELSQKKAFCKKCYTFKTWKALRSPGPKDQLRLYLAHHYTKNY